MIKTKSFRPTKLELYKVSMVNYFKSDFWYLVLIWAVAIFLMIKRSDNLFNICFFALAILYPFFIAVKYWIQFSSNDFKKNLIERYYEIDENTISIKYEDGRTTTLEISSFLKYIRTKNYFLLFPSIRSYLLLPYNIINNTEDLDWINNILSSKINRNISVQTQPKKKVPIILYILSALCLIPLIGAFVGLVILMLGIFEYKNKIVIGLGALGIFITVVVYSSLSYFDKSQSGEKYDKLIEVLSQDYLTKLVKKIETYKTSTGHYPLKLEQLVDEKSLPSIEDPILIRTERKADKRLFYYKQIDNGYLLFSIGYDKKPFTEDDIFPKLTEDELKVFGYKQKK